jgi:hypothetical protein
VGLYSVFPGCVPTKSKRERVIMSESIDIAPGQQRLFQDRAGRCVLLHKAGIAVSFIMDEDGTARVVERIEGIDFKATGSQFKRDGWTCIGPGMAYARLLEPESGGDDPDVHQ